MEQVIRLTTLATISKMFAASKSRASQLWRAQFVRSPWEGPWPLCADKATLEELRLSGKRCKP